MAGVRLSKTVSISIDSPVDHVYAFVSNPENLPQWVTSFVQSANNTASGWIVETPNGPMEFEFVPANEFGVLDHRVRLASGTEIVNPMRVVRNGQGSELMFTLFQLPEMSDEQFTEDANMVERDLCTLKRVLEGDR